MWKMILLMLRILIYMMSVCVMSVIMLCHVVIRFDSVSTIYEPVGDGRADNCFISKSYDATSVAMMRSDVVLLSCRQLPK